MQTVLPYIVNGSLIKEREAQLVIRLVNAIVDYIEDVESIYTK